MEEIMDPKENSNPFDMPEPTEENDFELEDQKISNLSSEPNNPLNEPASNPDNEPVSNPDNESALDKQEEPEATESSEIKGLEEYIPIARYLKDNPDALEAVGKALFGKTEQPAQPEAPPLVKPVKPKKPEGYSKYEAQNDPDSLSAKYEEALIDYNEKLAEYLDRVSENKFQEIDMFKQNLQRAEIERRQVDAINAMKAELKNRHGFNEKQAQENIWADINLNSMIWLIFSKLKTKQKLRRKN